MYKPDYKKTADGYAYDYPRASITTDCVIFGFNGHDLQVLLIRRGVEPYKDSWALPGGFLKMNETVAECAFRELQEETTLQPETLEQFGVFSDVERDPRGRVVTIAFYALVKQAFVKGGDDAADAQWFPLKQLPHLAFDHYDILKEAQLALKRDIHHQPVAFRLLAEHFSMTQLQRLYEDILETQFDRRNFYKKMLASGVITEQKPEDDAKHKLKKLFSFNLTAYADMKKKTTNNQEF